MLAGVGCANTYTQAHSILAAVGCTLMAFETILIRCTACDMLQQTV